MGYAGEEYVNVVVDRVPGGGCPRCGSREFVVVETLMAATCVNLGQPWMTTPGAPELRTLQVECVRCQQVVSD